MERERGGPGGKLGTGQKGLEQRGFSKGASAKGFQQRGLQQSGFSKKGGLSIEILIFKEPNQCAGSIIMLPPCGVIEYISLFQP